MTVSGKRWTGFHSKFYKGSTVDFSKTAKIYGAFFYMALVFFPLLSVAQRFQLMYNG